MEDKKIYEVKYSYDYYDGEMYGYGGCVENNKGFFTTLEKAKEVANSKELVDELISRIGDADWDHRIIIGIYEHILDKVEEYGNIVYEYRIEERITDELEPEYGICYVTRILRVENGNVTEIGRSTGYKASFENQEDEA